MESEHELSSFTNNTRNVCLISSRNAQTNAMSAVRAELRRRIFLPSPRSTPFGKSKSSMIYTNNRYVFFELVTNNCNTRRFITVVRRVRLIASN